MRDIQIKVIIAGGREFDDYEYMKECLDNLLSAFSFRQIEVVSGGAQGADSLGERYAKIRGLKLKVFPAEWKKHGDSAGYIRNSEMAEYADSLVAFWDGKSKGTKHMINLTQEREMQVRVKYYE